MPNNNYIITSNGGFISESELYHYGVPGMKWGVRKAQKKYAELDSKKAAYKKAKKAYNKSFNKAYNRSIAAYSPFEKHRKANDKRWNDVTKKAEKLNAAKKDLKNIKKEVRKNTTVGQKIGRGSKTAVKVLANVGRLYIQDQVLLDGAGTKAAKKAVSNMLDRTTAYSVLDSNGKTIRRYN